MVTAVRPQWIAKMYAAKVGRDHLGLGSLSSDQILPSLSPSVNVLTYSSSPTRPGADRSTAAVGRAAAPRRAAA